MADEVEIATGFPFRSELYTTLSTEVRLLRGDNIVQGTIRWDGVKRWPGDQCQDFDKYRLREGDVVLAMDRPWIEAGLKWAWVSEADLPSLLVQRVARLRGREGLDTKFLRYVISSRQFTQHVLSVQTGTAVPHISSKQIGDFRFYKPPLAEQQAVAEVLGALDDKIELNRRMNATLEELARTIFRSWFVDFDPVHARAEGRAPFGMDAATAALFPDAFVPSELGDIPAGWGMYEVKYLASLSRMSIQPQYFALDTFDLFSLPAFDSGRMPERTAGSSIKSGKFIVPHGAVLLSKLNPSIQRVWAPEVEGTVRAITSTEFLVFVPSHTPDRPFVYQLFQSQPFRDRMVSQASGTSNSHQRVRPDDVLEADVIQPPQQVKDAFNMLVEPMMAKSSSNLRESRTLAELRDTLLPKLLSGEITVKAADRELVSAV